MPRRTITPVETAVADSKSSRTRARLLHAAAKVLARKGFSGTRLSDIADEAHVQTPAIYYYYPSREDLIEAVLFEGSTAMLQHLLTALAALPPGATPSERLGAAVEAHLRNELELSDFSRAVVRNANQIPEEFSRRALGLVAEYNEIWRGLIDDLAASGLLRDDVEPSIARMLVLGALNWSVEWWDPQRGSIDHVISVARSMILHALRP